MYIYIYIFFSVGHTLRTSIFSKSTNPTLRTALFRPLSPQLEHRVRTSDQFIVTLSSGCSKCGVSPANNGF